MLSDAQKSFYADNGYLVVEDAIDPARLETLRAVTDELVERSRAVRENDELYDLDEGHSSATPRPNRIKLPHARHPAYRNVLSEGRVAAVLRDLLGENVRLHTSKLNTKPGGGGAAVEWHQDWAFYPHTNDDLLALGIMLADVDEDSGPLLVIPGSHRGPVLDHSRDGVFCGAVDPDDPDFDASGAVALTGRAGSMSVHHARTLHGSAPNRSAKARLLLLYECGAADAWPIAGGSAAFTGLDPEALWSSLAERMILGEQPRVARLAPVPVRMPLPPPADASSIFAVQKSGAAASALGG